MTQSAHQYGLQSLELRTTHACHCIPARTRTVACTTHFSRRGAVVVALRDVIESAWIAVENGVDEAHRPTRRCCKIAVPDLQTRLIVAVAGKQLEVGKTLFDYNIKKNTHIFVVGKLRGGTSQAPINIETAEGKNEFQTRVSSWYTDRRTGDKKEPRVNCFKLDWTAPEQTQSKLKVIF